MVLETLAPAERLASVLHDVFAVPFEEIAPIVGRSPAAARQLASRARRRVRDTAPAPDADLPRQRAVVDAFVTASRDGDFQALLAVLDPDVVLRLDRGAVPAGASREVRGAAAVVDLGFRFSGDGWVAVPAVVNGAAGVIVARRGQAFAVIVKDGRRGRDDHGRAGRADDQPGRIRVSPGSGSPTAARTSATPRKSWNHLGKPAFRLSVLLAVELPSHGRLMRHRIRLTSCFLHSDRLGPPRRW